MEINLRLEKSVIPTIKNIIKNNPRWDELDFISHSSVATGAHVISCAYYVASVIGMNDKIQTNIDNLMKMYQIEKVLYIEEFLSK